MKPLPHCPNERVRFSGPLICKSEYWFEFMFLFVLCPFPGREGAARAELGMNSSAPQTSTHPAQISSRQEQKAEEIYPASLHSNKGLAKVQAAWDKQSKVPEIAAEKEAACAK